jgi:aminopeptidase
METQELQPIATMNIRDTLEIALQHTSSERALVVFDTETELSRILLEAYKVVLPDAHFLEFHTHTKDQIIAQFDALSPRDLVVLIQSRDFRLNEFRIRIHLFQKSLKVVDHLHLYRMHGKEIETYLHALSYDQDWYRCFGEQLAQKIEHAQRIVYHYNEDVCSVEGGFEVPKRNLGNYVGMQNIGGTFPIGEVFTEAKELNQMNGSLWIQAFADTSFEIVFHEPFRIDIKSGTIIDWSVNTPASFIAVLDAVRSNERCLIRELGFGLNRAITTKHYVSDITAFERIIGPHVSLGEKHTVYKKQGITADRTRFHVDLFPIVDSITLDDTPIFEKNQYIIT